MIQVSDLWKDKIKEQFRYQGCMRATITVVPPGVSENAVVNASSISPVATVDNLVFRDKPASKAVATFEPNRWLLDGSFDLLSDMNAKVPDWWSEYSPNSTITVTLDAECDLPGITIYWDTVLGTAPTDLTVVGLDLQGVEKYRYEYRQELKAVSALEAPMSGVYKLVLTIGGWSPSDLWRARMAFLVLGLDVSYESTNSGFILSGETLDASDPLSGSLPTHTASIRLRNQNKELDPTLQTGLARYLAQRQLMKVQWGFTLSPGSVEWSPDLHYYISSFSIPADSKEVSIEATSRLAFLTHEHKKSYVSDAAYPLEAAAFSVLNESPILRESAEETPWLLSPKLQNYHTKAPLPVMATNALLQLIAGAACCWLLTDPTSGYVQITETPLFEKTSIGLQQQLGDPSIEVQELLHSVSVKVYKYPESSEVSELSNGSYTLNEGVHTLEIMYSAAFANNVLYELEAPEGSVSVKSFEAYSSCAFLTVEVLEPSTDVGIVLKGNELKQSSTTIQTYLNASSPQGLDVVVDNPLITETDEIQDISDWVVYWYSRRQKLQLNYLGYPEVTSADGCLVDTLYTEALEGTVLSNKITFNGAFTGVMEVK